MRKTGVRLIWVTICFPLLVGLSGCQKKTDELDIENVKPTPDKEAIYGVYIPTDLNDCSEELIKMLPEQVVDEIRKRPREEMAIYHLGLGSWIRRNWGLRKDSRLAKYFRENGVSSPDDMSSMALDALWCKLHNVATPAVGPQKTSVYKSSNEASKANSQQ